MKPPKHLSREVKKWFAQVIESYELEPHHLRLLALAAESWDRTCQARAIIDAQGMTYLDRFGAPRARPEISIERDSRTAFCRIIRELDLDVDAPAQASRPPALRSVR